MKGYVFDLQRFSLDNGPGVRTTVFLKGCPLRCPWCHNPESLDFKPQLAYIKSKCVSCGACGFCPVHEFKNQKHKINFKNCSACGKCVKICPTGALSIIGYKTSAKEIMDEALLDKDYYDATGGGITFSGGEALAQPLFLYELLILSKKAEAHTCLDTSGYASEEVFLKIAPLVDLFLFDYKISDSNEHKKIIGADNILILKNLALTERLNKPVILRLPIIPNINDNDLHIKNAEKLKAQHKNIIDIQILPYHSVGLDKLEQIRN